MSRFDLAHRAGFPCSLVLIGQPYDHDTCMSIPIMKIISIQGQQDSTRQGRYRYTRGVWPGRLTRADTRELGRLGRLAAPDSAG